MKTRKISTLFRIVAVSIIALTAIPLMAQPVDDAYKYLSRVMDQCHERFGVYENINSASNHFSELAKMPDAHALVTIDPCWTDDPHSPPTCIRCTFEPGYVNWGGFYFQNGVLLKGENSPQQNWGEHPEAGYDLSGATELTFYAKGHRGGERVKFFIGGIGWSGSLQVGDFPESLTQTNVVRRGTDEFLDYVELTSEWAEYTIPLEGEDLSYMLSGFGWVTDSFHNSDQPITFFIDDIYLNKPRRDDERFLLSYEVKPTRETLFDEQMVNVAYAYDSALALLAYLARGTEDDLRRARILADTFLYAVENDPTQHVDSSPRLLIRNAYAAGDPALPPGWNPNGVPGEIRIAGYWNCENQAWFELDDALKSYSGNVAWSIIALTAAFQRLNDQSYLDTAIKLGEWIEKNCRDEAGYGGYTAGYEGYPPEPERLFWKSTEHNLHLYVAFWWLYSLTNETKWEQAAMHAKKFVETMWDEQENKLWTGTTGTVDPLTDEGTINRVPVALDAQTGLVLASRGMDINCLKAIEYAEQNHSVNGGFDFDTDRDGIWYEGTAQMACAYQVVGQNDKADELIALIERVQSNGAVPAASKDSLTTGLGWYYFNRNHVAATAWYIFAKLEKNPDWLTQPATEPPGIECALPETIWINY